MIVDIYTHIMPPEFLKSMESLGSSSGLVKRMAAIRELHDLDARFRAMDEFGDYRQIFSIPNPPIETVTTPAQGRDLARIANDAMADTVRRHPSRFPTFIAALPLHTVDSAMEELKRAIETLGARGIQIFTHVNGRPLDDQQYEPLFAAMAGYDLPIWLHPARTAAMTDYASEKQSRLEMWWCFGWPYETSVAMSRLVLSGIFDRYPKLKIITHHLGGMIPYFDKRIEMAWLCWARARRPKIIRGYCRRSSGRSSITFICFMGIRRCSASRAGWHAGWISLARVTSSSQRTRLLGRLRQRVRASRI